MRLYAGTRLLPLILDTLGAWFPRQQEEILELRGKAKVGLQIDIKAIGNKRTLEQNALYWDIVTALAEFSGMTKGEMHEELLCELHGYDVIVFRGSEHKRPRGRSSGLSRGDFSPLIEIGMRWCAEMGVVWEKEAME